MKTDKNFFVLQVGLSTASQRLLCALLFSNLAFIPAVQAGPTGANIVGGVGHIHNNGLNTVIHQDSSSLAINWDQFNIKRDERVQFLQPNATSISLNRATRGQILS